MIATPRRGNKNEDDSKGSPIKNAFGKTVAFLNGIVRWSAASAKPFQTKVNSSSLAGVGRNPKTTSQTHINITPDSKQSSPAKSTPGSDGSDGSAAISPDRLPTKLRGLVLNPRSLSFGEEAQEIIADISAPDYLDDKKSDEPEIQQLHIEQFPNSRIFNKFHEKFLRYLSENKLSRIEDVLSVAALVVTCVGLIPFMVKTEEPGVLLNIISGISDFVSLVVFPLHFAYAPSVRLRLNSDVVRRLDREIMGLEDDLNKVAIAKDLTVAQQVKGKLRRDFDAIKSKVARLKNFPRLGLSWNSQQVDKHLERSFFIIMGLVFLFFCFKYTDNNIPLFGVTLTLAGFLFANNKLSQSFIAEQDSTSTEFELIKGRKSDLKLEVCGRQSMLVSCSVARTTMRTLNKFTAAAQEQNTLEEVRARELIKTQLLDLSSDTVGLILENIASLQQLLDARQDIAEEKEEKAEKAENVFSEVRQILHESWMQYRAGDFIESSPLYFESIIPANLQAMLKNIHEFCAMATNAVNDRPVYIAVNGNVNDELAEMLDSIQKTEPVIPLYKLLMVFFKMLDAICNAPGSDIAEVDQTTLPSFCSARTNIENLYDRYCQKRDAIAVQKTVFTVDPKDTKALAEQVIILNRSFDDARRTAYRKVNSDSQKVADVLKSFWNKYQSVIEPPAEKAADKPADERTLSVYIETPTI